MTDRPTCSVVGVLLAAGRGRRMGTLKQILPWNESTIVESAFDGLAPFCDAGLIVVLGAEADRVAAALEPREFTRVDSDPDAEMFESARRGLTAAMRCAGATHALLHPADHPEVARSVVEQMFRAAGDRVIIPTYNGKGGHPVLIPTAILPELLAWRGKGGLRAYWELHPDLIERIEFPEAPGLTLDLDTPTDYRAGANLMDSPQSSQRAQRRRREDASTEDTERRRRIW